MNGIGALVKEAPESGSSDPPATQEHNEKTVIREEDREPASALILDFLDSKTVTNKFLLFISHLAYGILL